jgi:hypothetical protein
VEDETARHVACLGDAMRNLKGRDRNEDLNIDRMNVKTILREMGEECELDSFGLD